MLIGSAQYPTPYSSRASQAWVSGFAFRKMLKKPPLLSKLLAVVQYQAWCNDGYRGTPPELEFAPSVGLFPLFSYKAVPCWRQTRPGIAAWANNRDLTGTGKWWGTWQVRCLSSTLTDIIEFIVKINVTSIAWLGGPLDSLTTSARRTRNYDSNPLSRMVY